MEVDQYASLAFLASVYPAGRSSGAGLDTGSTLGSTALAREQEIATDAEPFEAQAMDEIHEAIPQVEWGQVRLPG